MLQQLEPPFYVHPLEIFNVLIALHELDMIDKTTMAKLQSFVTTVASKGQPVTLPEFFEMAVSDSIIDQPTATMILEALQMNPGLYWQLLIEMGTYGPPRPPGGGR